jgi:hypothetical protein
VSTDFSGCLKPSRRRRSERCKYAIHYILDKSGRSRLQQDLKHSLAAQVRDPLWFLARQWQLGEFRGEDAALARLHPVRRPLFAHRRLGLEADDGMVGAIT